MDRRRATDAVTDADIDLSRREALLALGSGGLALGAGKAVDNVLLGYGVLVGTNLIEQDLAALARERLAPSPATVPLGDHRLVYRPDRIVVGNRAGERVADLRVSEATVDQARDLETELGLSGDPLSSLIADLRAVDDGRHRFVFSDPDAFFDRVDSGDSRPMTVAALRGNRFHTPAPELIETFTEAEPSDPAAVVEGLATGFREYSRYDIPRYVAGSAEDHLLLGAVDLRSRFESPATFEAILAGENDGLFCYEFAHRSVEALHAVPPHRQDVPVFSAVATDNRHKHAYTGVASAVREDGELLLPMTFVDYTHSTLYDDLELRGILGEGLAAYDERHRTDGIYWNRYAVV